VSRHVCIIVQIQCLTRLNSICTRRHDTVNTMPQKAGRGNRAILRKAPGRGYISTSGRFLLYNTTRSPAQKCPLPFCTLANTARKYRTVNSTSSNIARSSATFKRMHFHYYTLSKSSLSYSTVIYTVKGN